MSFIEGRNLAEISLQKDFDFWRDGLPIIINVCKHLRFSHNLPQGVLHRDVRPSNIMVPEFGWSEIEAVDYGIDRYKAILLNYDMSWHVNAKGGTISGKLEEAGFYAPELLENAFGSLARRTYIDSYGIGMTLYYCFVKQNPPNAGSKSTDWAENLRQKFRPKLDGRWRSAAERLRRIIVAATQTNDEDRDTIDTIIGKLEVLQSMLKGKLDRLSSDVWAEELMSRTVQTHYDTMPGEQAFSRDIKAGRIISIKGAYRRSFVELSYSNAATEHTDRSAGKLWSEKLRAAEGILTSSGWTVKAGTTSRGREIKLSAKIEVSRLEQNVEKSAKDLSRAIDQIRLD